MTNNTSCQTITVGGKEYEYVVYDLSINQVLEQCATCPLELPFSSDVCLQCNHEWTLRNVSLGDLIEMGN